MSNRRHHRRDEKVKQDTRSYHVYGTSIKEENEKADMWLTRKQKEEKYKNKFVPEWQQKVRDKEGRVRFHGAFTGGWSAGHYNTVGSKEGWTPKTFKSSRSNRSKYVQRPEDHMDEEDLQDLGLGTEIVANTNYKTSFSSAEDKRKSDIYASVLGQGSSIPGPAPNEMISSTNRSIGQKLLGLMGWKEGQGVGPRKKKKVVTVLKEEDYSSGFKFAPRDVEVVKFKRKSNSHGIGYNPGTQRNKSMKKLDVLTLGSVLKGGHKTSKMGAFGYGALEEKDEFYDPYQYDDLSQYDQEIGTKRPKQKPQRNSHRDSTSKPEYDASGRLVLADFVPAKRPLPRVKSYPAPIIPSNFNLKHEFDTPGPGVPTNSEIAQHSFMNVYYVHTSEERGKLLGETPLPGPPTPTQNRFVAGGIVDPNVLDNEPLFKQANPFPNSPEKKRRYDTWVKVQNGEVSYDVNWSKGISPDQAAQENAEFGRLYNMLRPSTGILAKRFESASSILIPGEEFEEEEEDSGVLIIRRSEITWYPDRLLCKRFNIKNPHSGGNPKNSNSMQVFENIATKNRIEDEPEEVKPDLVGVPELSDDEEAVPTIEKPSIDLFKAIFEDSESSDSEEEEEPSGNEPRNRVLHQNDNIQQTNNITKELEKHPLFERFKNERNISSADVEAKSFYTVIDTKKGEKKKDKRKDKRKDKKDKKYRKDKKDKRRKRRKDKKEKKRDKKKRGKKRKHREDYDSRKRQRNSRDSYTSRY
eukprot:TRINITY_DN1950_c0_g1_i1.p1 TRINITY_DN1950_c0_g1~~TRINITY_DN1950_c0_g1_i1.p1  ORF type:complete len:748 (+),score=217.65 TRINITY_DN1950_c0_g1_i1:19-2262(+)